MQKYVIYTDSMLEDSTICKTAHCMLRHMSEHILCIYDTKYKGKLVKDVISVFRDANIPIIGSIQELLLYNNIQLIKDEILFVIGFAPAGGNLTLSQNSVINNILAKNIKIINGMHDMIDHPLVENLRHQYSDDKYLAQGRLKDSKRILFVGTDHSIGKLTSTVMLYNSMKKLDYDVDWIATGQTGLILKQKGRVIDSMVIDFVPGNIEDMINSANSKYVLIEGQGSIFHPAYSPTSFALFHSSQPQYLILCHKMNQKYGHFGNKLVSLKKAIEFYQNLADLYNFNTTVLGISLNSAGYSEKEYLDEKARISEELGLPCCDTIRDDPKLLLSLIEEEENEHNNISA